VGYIDNEFPFLNFRKFRKWGELFSYGIVASISRIYSFFNFIIIIRCVNQLYSEFSRQRDGRVILGQETVQILQPRCRVVNPTAF
jgi:hypothetical protein